MKNKILSYKKTLLSPIMLMLIFVHTCEDVALLSIGRFAPLPTPLMYMVGLGLSWVVMSGIVHKYLGVSHHSKHDTD
jgi:hypothetical protein